MKMYKTKQENCTILVLEHVEGGLLERLRKRKRFSGQNVAAEFLLLFAGKASLTYDVVEFVQECRKTFTFNAKLACQEQNNGAFLVIHSPPL